MSKKECPDKAMPAEMKISASGQPSPLPERPFSVEYTQNEAKNRLARFGNALARHPIGISRIQWTMVFIYFSLLLLPALFPLPEFSRFSRLVFWGIGWPLIVLSMMLGGRFWCGIFCPDGTLTEFISGHGKKGSIPRWIRWQGWPCTMLVGTTLYGQSTGFYENYPATLVLLGIPTCMALLTGYLYGNSKRIWCMYLCPGNGFFGLLSKIAPIHFRVNREKWKRFSGPPKRINCAPLINIRQMQSASACHACGRCNGYRDAVELAARPFSIEIVSARDKTVSGTDAFLLVWGIMGIVTLSLAWAQSSLHEQFMEMVKFLDLPLHFKPPWWLSSSPASLYRLAFIVLTVTMVSLLVYGFLCLASRISENRVSWKHLSFCLIPLAGWGIFLGLCRLGASVWQEYGFSLPWVPFFETAVLALGTVLSFWLGIKVIMQHFSTKNVIATLIYCLPLVLLNYLWLG